MVAIYTNGEKVSRDSGMEFKPILLILSWIFTMLKRSKLEIKKHAKWFALNHSQSAGFIWFKLYYIILLLHNQILLDLKLLTGPWHRRVSSYCWCWDMPYTVHPCVSRKQEPRVMECELQLAVQSQYLANSTIYELLRAIRGLWKH